MGIETALEGLRGHNPFKLAIVAAASFTRPNDTTAYASGDLVANSTTAATVTRSSLSVSRLADSLIRIRRVRLKKSGAVITNASFRVHFYRTDPGVPAGGDNAAWSTAESGYLGSIDVTIDKAFTDGAKGFGAATAGAEVIAQPGVGLQTIFALIEARAAYTPAAQEIFTLEAEIEQA
jgi:hypothetical protein